MQFLYHKQAGEQKLFVDGELYKYIFKVRRHAVQNLYFRNLKQANLYTYQVSSISKKSAQLDLKATAHKKVEADKKLHLGWCVIDPKVIEKTLPSLNEIGVESISFFPCDYSQNNFRLNFERMKKILINSSQQCGRSSIISLNWCESIKEFMSKYPHSWLIDFSHNTINRSSFDEQTSFIIGCEGGFSQSERAQFKENKIIGFDSDLILRSESAAIAVASKILL